MRASTIAGLVGIVLLAAFLDYFGSRTAVINTVPSVASSTANTLTEVANPPETVASLPDAGPSSSTPVKQPSPVAAPKKVLEKAPVAAAPVAVAVPQPVPPTSGDVSLDQASSRLRGALVNILCTASYPLSSISGTGVIIDPKGVILTNAHVAEYFLLKDYPTRGSTSCIIRTGSPARDSYRAELIFISPAWINANSTVLTKAAPTGTGEYDYALLSITTSADSSPLPATFPYVPLSGTEDSLNTPVVIGSYAAQFLQTSQIQSSLYPTIVFGLIRSVFTFAVNSVDVISLGGTAAAQEGSSGGGIVDRNGTLLGTITTSTNADTTSARDLRAITASYIRRDFQAETGGPIDPLIAEDQATAISNFAEEIPALSSIITSVLSR